MLMKPLAAGCADGFAKSSLVLELRMNYTHFNFSQFMHPHPLMRYAPMDECRGAKASLIMPSLLLLALHAGKKFSHKFICIDYLRLITFTHSW